MNEEELFCKLFPDYAVNGKPLSPYFDLFESGYEQSENHIEELEEENAELKGLKDIATLIRANNDTVTTLMQLNNKLVSKSQQLTKAKELLKEFVHHYKAKTIYIENMKDLLEQAEQFLSEVEK